MGPLGVEWDSAAADFARRITGARFTTGDFSYVDLPSESFEHIWMQYVIEHLDNPIEGLERIRDLLVSTGRAVIAYPNPAALELVFFISIGTPGYVRRHLVVPPVELLMPAARVSLDVVEGRTSAKRTPYIL